MRRSARPLTTDVRTRGHCSRRACGLLDAGGQQYVALEVAARALSALQLTRVPAQLTRADAVWVTVTIIVRADAPAHCLTVRSLSASTCSACSSPAQRPSLTCCSRAYGEAEFWLAMGKVLLITGLISASPNVEGR